MASDDAGEWNPPPSEDIRREILITRKKLRTDKTDGVQYQKEHGPIVKSLQGLPDIIKLIQESEPPRPVSQTAFNSARYLTWVLQLLSCGREDPKVQDLMSQPRLLSQLLRQCHAASTSALAYVNLISCLRMIAGYCANTQSVYFTDLMLFQENMLLALISDTHRITLEGRYLELLDTLIKVDEKDGLLAQSLFDGMVRKLINSSQETQRTVIPSVIERIGVLIENNLAGLAHIPLETTRKVEMADWIKLANNIPTAILNPQASHWLTFFRSIFEIIPPALDPKQSEYPFQRTPVEAIEHITDIQSAFSEFFKPMIAESVQLPHRRAHYHAVLSFLLAFTKRQVRPQPWHKEFLSPCLLMLVRGTLGKPGTPPFIVLCQLCATLLTLLGPGSERFQDLSFTLRNFENPSFPLPYRVPVFHHLVKPLVENTYLRLGENHYISPHIPFWYPPAPISHSPSPFYR